MKQAILGAKMQLAGLDINLSSLSKLEGQIRIASDIELKTIAHILGVMWKRKKTENTLDVRFQTE